MSGPLRTVLAAAAVLVAGGPAAAAGDPPPGLRSGAVELGLAGSLVSSGVAGRASTVSVRGAILRAVGAGLAGFGAEVGYRHVGNFGDLDQVRTIARIDGLVPFGETSAYPFVALWGGVDHERVGSFGQTRYPFGAGVGLLALVSRGAALRVEYRYGRVHDPDVSDFDEHEVLTGITLIFRNGS